VKLTEQALVIILDENWVNLILNPTLFLTSDFIALIQEELARHARDPTKHWYRDSCARICRAGIQKKLLKDRAAFDAAFDCCRTVERRHVAADVVREYSLHCKEAQDCLAVLKSCQKLSRAELMDLAARMIHCRDSATFTSVFNVCIEMNRPDLAAQIIIKYRSDHGRNDLERAESVLSLIKSKSPKLFFTELQERCVARRAFDLC
jgi:hypothetical protein